MLSIFFMIIAQVIATDTRNVILFGDSLMDRPYREYDLAGKLDAKLSFSHNYTYYDEGQSGSKIADIYARTSDMLQRNSVGSNDIVLLFWDSDCSDIDESTMTAGQVTELRETYKANLQSVISLILAKTSYFAVAGPEILGEGPIGEGYFGCGRFAGKEEMLNDYRDMTKEVTIDNNVPYLDMRQAFFDAIPPNWYVCSGSVTKDGEHPNERGTDIEASIFADQINSWMKSV